MQLIRHSDVVILSLFLLSVVGFWVAWQVSIYVKVKAFRDELSRW